MTAPILRGKARLFLTGAAAIAAAAVTVAVPTALQAQRAAPQIADIGVTNQGVVLLALGESRVVNLSQAMADIIIADPAVMDVVVNSQRQLYLIPKGPGQTDITITGSSGKPIYKAIVRVGANITSVDQMLRLAMPEADIKVTTMNGLMLLTGTVAAPEDAAEAERLVGAFAGDKMNVVSRLKTATPLTVNLQVRIAEVSKSVTKSLGVGFATGDSTGGFKFGVTRGRSVGPLVPGGPLGVGLAGASSVAGNGAGSTFGAAGSLLGLDILSAIDIAETQGLAATLANPNITALSGETASFLAGGEIPIPLSTGLGQVSVDYKQYGVSLAFTPTVLADGRISMRVRPEVSSLDYGNAVSLGNGSIPGISSRRAETTVELGSGQSFMIGGLLQSTTGNTVDKLPLLGDLPILGALFKSSGFRRNETELVIIVTPYLVKPIDAKDIRLPTDGYRNATDAGRYLGSRMHAGRDEEQRPVPTMAPPRTVTEGEVMGASGAAVPAPTRSRGKGAAAPGFSF